ncbi:hypothetical protein ACFSJY_05125 [Thalassotalea euphylliae]|uniref:hypothetical protein n=1 Tax=Thalassotalea euphylliae TaxID=1655234 RepID=UPI003639390E
MFSLFKSKPLLSSADQEFLIATFKWLLRNFGGDDFYKLTNLVLPTKQHFPDEVDSPEAAAAATFKSVKKHANMDSWDCKLQEQEEDANPLVAPTMVVQNSPTSPNGTFQATENNEVIITYNPALVGQPIQLVATLAHELAHYLTATSPEEPPGGWENWEFATDVAATFMGFGLFMANSAFNFSQYTDTDSQGWKTSRSGYLSETEHIYALALFIKLKKLPDDAAHQYLKPHLKKLMKKVIKEIDKSDLIGELKAVEFKPCVSEKKNAQYEP